MLTNIKKKMRKDEEEGFTLIELLVVVLILGILMAIAIPTFLSLTSGAKTNAAESDLTTAAQDEATYFTQNGTYAGTGTLTAATALAAVDPGLNWAVATMGASGAKNIDVASASATEVILGTAGQNSTYYWIDIKSGALTYAFTSAPLPSGPSSSDFTGHTSWSSLSSLTASST